MVSLLGIWYSTLFNHTILLDITMNEFEAVMALFPQDNLANEISDKVRDDVDFAILARDWLEIKGWTQKELAEKLGMKTSQLSLILSGNTNLTLKTIRRFERVFDERLLTFAPSPLENIILQESLMYSLQSESSITKKYDVEQNGLFRFDENAKIGKPTIFHLSSSQPSYEVAA